MSLEAIYSGLKMSLASAFNEHEHFTLDDVMAVSQNGVDRFCDGLSIIQSLKAAGKNLYESVTERFNAGLGV